MYSTLFAIIEIYSSVLPILNLRVRPRSVTMCKSHTSLGKGAQLLCGVLYTYINSNRPSAVSVLDVHMEACGFCTSPSLCLVLRGHIHVCIIIIFRQRSQLTCSLLASGIVIFPDQWSWYARKGLQYSILP